MVIAMCAMRPSFVTVPAEDESMFCRVLMHDAAGEQPPCICGPDSGRAHPLVCTV